MSVDSANHDDVAGLFKRLGTRAGAPQYHDFSGEPSSAPAALTPGARVHKAPIPEPAAVPAVDLDAVLPAVQMPVAAHGPIDVTPLQSLFQRLAQVPLQDAGQSPLARLRQR